MSPAGKKITIVLIQCSGSQGSSLLLFNPAFYSSNSLAFTERSHDALGVGDRRRGVYNATSLLARYYLTNEGTNEWKNERMKEKISVLFCSWGNAYRITRNVTSACSTIFIQVGEFFDLLSNCNSWNIVCEIELRSAKLKDLTSTKPAIIYVK